VEAYGKRIRNDADWYEANLSVMEPLTAAKRSALIQYKKDPNRKRSGLLARSNEEKSTTGKALCK